MRKVYNCFKCGKWFEKPKKVKRIGEVEICPFCGQRVYPVRGIKRALVCLWWWLKELFLSGDRRSQGRKATEASLIKRPRGGREGRK